MSKLTQNTADLQAILDTANALPEDGGAEPALQDKTVTPTTSKQTITADSGYDGLDTVTVNAMPTATQATPSVSVNSSGLITASVTQSAGYVTAGTRSATKQLTTQGAQIITPGTSDKTITSGIYITGTQTIKGDVNLVADNIKSGVSIFGVNGTLSEGSASGGIEYSESEDAVISRNISDSYTNNRVVSIGDYAFYRCSNLTTVSFPAATSIGMAAFCRCSNLTTVSFPAATSIGDYAFSACSNLTTVSFPAATSIGMNAFSACSNLTTVSFPVATSIGNYAFYRCSNLTTVSFPVAINIGDYAFSHCSNLTTVSLPAVRNIDIYAFGRCRMLNSLTIGGAPNICTLSNSNAFEHTPYAGYSSFFSGRPYIYVPASLLTSYQTATNWSYFSQYMVGDESLDVEVGTDSETIRFYIGDNEYQADPGMTWEYWVTSLYNIEGFFIQEYGTRYVLTSDYCYVCDENYSEVLAEDEIMADYTYTIN